MSDPGKVNSDDGQAPTANAGIAPDEPDGVLRGELVEADVVSTDEFLA